MGVFTAPSGGDIAWYLHGPQGKDISEHLVIVEHSGGPGDSTTREDSHEANSKPAVETGEAYTLHVDPSGSGESRPLFGDRNPRKDERHLPTAEQLATDHVALLGHLGVKRYAQIGGSNGTLINSLVILGQAEKALSRKPDWLPDAATNMWWRFKGSKQEGLWLPEWTLDWGVTNADPQRYREQHARGSNLETESPEAFELFMNQIPEEIQEDGRAVLEYMHSTVFPQNETPENMDKAKRLIGAWGSLRYVLAYHGEERVKQAKAIAGLDPLEIFEFGEASDMQPLHYGRNAIRHMYVSSESPLNILQRFRNLPQGLKPPRYILAAKNDPLTLSGEAVELGEAYGDKATVDPIEDEGHNRAGAVIGPMIQNKIVELVLQDAKSKKK